MDAKEIVKKYWPVGLAAGAILFIVLKMRGGSSAQTVSYVPASSGTSDAAALQEQAQVAQIGLAQQAQVNAANNAEQTNAIQYTAALGTAAQNVGSAIASIYTAEAQLPATAIAAAANQNQVALSSAAQVAATGVAALPGTLNAAANMTAAAYLPLASYANGIGGIVSDVEGNSAATLNAVGGNGSSASNAAAASASAGAASSANRGSNTVNGAATGATAGAAFGPYGMAAGAVIGGVAGYMGS